jgi:hypothetical protein
MFAWEKRLRDLSILLKNCGATYFKPDLFRQNINQFLQTSRTVTFIVQKNKSDIPEFVTWYKEHVLDPWGTDGIMTWARDSRNVVEKEGDLEMYSLLSTSLIFSHIPSQDVVIETPEPYLVRADIDKIIKLAKTTLPSHMLDEAVLQIERRWVANSLPDHELIFAFTYVYSRLYQMCHALAHHLGGQLDKSIPSPSNLDPVSNDVACTRFIKLRKPGMGRFKTFTVERDLAYEPPAKLHTLMKELNSLAPPKSLDDLVERASKMAEFTFEEHGNHLPMLFLFDDKWKQVEFLSTGFGDQADKFLFWRNAAKRVAYLRAAAFIWVSEVWIRSLDKGPNVPIRERKITGEQLQLVAGGIDAETKMIEWTIVRSTETKSVSLERLAPRAYEKGRPRFFFVEPLIEAMRSVRTKQPQGAKQNFG